MRILITGSRDWDKPDAVGSALEYLYQLVRGASNRPMLVVHGDARGADRCARDWVEACRLRYAVDQEKHTVTDRMWSASGRSAAIQRNQRMVNAGATLCVAFSRRNSPGTAHCADRARQAGIPVWWHSYDHPPSDPPTRFSLGL